MQLDFSILKEGYMKYDFSGPITQHLEVKINGILNPKSWIRGIPEAAQRCEKIALRMALEVYVRACVDQGSPITIESAIRILSGIGFDKEAIIQEAKDGYFSVFFIMKEIL